MHLLHNIVQENVSVDILVRMFSNCVTDRVNVFFKKSSELKTENIFSYFSEKKKWYNHTSVLKKHKFQEAVRDFKLNKSDENRKRASKSGRITNVFVVNANKISTVLDVNR